MEWNASTVLTLAIAVLSLVIVGIWLWLKFTRRSATRARNAELASRQSEAGGDQFELFSSILNHFLGLGFALPDYEVRSNWSVNAQLVKGSDYVRLRLSQGRITHQCSEAIQPLADLILGEYLVSA